MRLKNLFSLDRYLVDTGSNYIDIYGIVKSVWLRQVFSLLRVRFRQISLYKYVLHWRSRYEEGRGGYVFPTIYAMDLSFGVLIR